jgi:hypothetical protein
VGADLARAQPSEKRSRRSWSSTTGVAIAGKVADVLGGDNDLIAKLADGGGEPRQNYVGIQGIRRCRGYARLAGVSPEQRRLTPSRGRCGQVGQPSRRDELVWAAERPGRIDARQLPSDFIVCNFGYNEDHAPSD